MPIEPREEYQKTGKNYNFEDEYTPQFVEEFFISNILQRVLAHLFAFDQTTDKPIRLQATSEGYLKVASVQTPLSINQSFKQSISAGASIFFFADDVSSKVEVWTYSGDLQIARSVDGTTYQDVIEIPAYSYYSFTASTKAIKVINPDTTNAHDIQIVFWR